jgi:hypothetical protein
MQGRSRARAVEKEGREGVQAFPGGVHRAAAAGRVRLNFAEVDGEPCDLQIVTQLDAVPHRLAFEANTTTSARGSANTPVPAVAHPPSRPEHQRG